MAKFNKEACIKVTLKHEGGYTNNRKDPGNWTGGKVGVGVLKGTNMGIAANSFPDLDIKNLTVADVIPIYEAKYWRKVSGDALPFGVDLAVYDYGVNSGVSRAVKTLQAAVGVKVDGVAGADTIVSANAVNGKKLIIVICARRMSFLKGLRTFTTFGKGWSRRVAEIEAKAVAMWLARGGDLTVDDKRVMANDGKLAKQVSVEQSKSATTAGGAGAIGSAGAGAEAMANTGNAWMIILPVAVIALIAAVILISRSRHNAERARAYLDQAL